MVNVYDIPRKNATAHAYQPATTIGSKQSLVRSQANNSEFRHWNTGIQERSRRDYTSAGPLLVEDAVAALAALDHITRLQRVLGSTIWKQKKVVPSEKTKEELKILPYSPNCGETTGD